MRPALQRILGGAWRLAVGGRKLESFRAFVSLPEVENETDETESSRIRNFAIIGAGALRGRT